MRTRGINRSCQCNLQGAVVGAFAVRVDCGINDRSFVYVSGNESQIFAGYVCGENCGEQHVYIPMQILGVPVLTQ